MDNEYSLLTSTRYDPFLKSCRWNDDHQGPQPFLLLSHHLDRLISAAEAHSWPNARSTLTYSHLKNACTEAVQSAQTEEASTAFKVISSLLFTHYPHTLFFFQTASDNRLKGRAKSYPYHHHCPSQFLVRSHNIQPLVPISASQSLSGHRTYHSLHLHADKNDFQRHL